MSYLKNTDNEWKKKYWLKDVFLIFDLDYLEVFLYAYWSVDGTVPLVKICL